MFLVCGGWEKLSSCIVFRWQSTNVLQFLILSWKLFALKVYWVILFTCHKFDEIAVRYCCSFCSSLFSNNSSIRLLASAKVLVWLSIFNFSNTFKVLWLSKAFEGMKNFIHSRCKLKHSSSFSLAANDKGGVRLFCKRFERSF